MKFTGRYSEHEEIEMVPEKPFLEDIYKDLARIDEHYNTKTAADIKKLLEPKKDKKEDTFWDRWDEFLNSKKGSCSEQTIKKYNTVKGHLNAFEEYRKDLFSFDNINDVTLEELQYFMYNSRDLNTQTTSKNIQLDINDLFPEREFNKSDSLFDSLPIYPLAQHFFDDLKELVFVDCVVVVVVGSAFFVALRTTLCPFL